MESTHLFGQSFSQLGIANLPEGQEPGATPWFLLLNSGILPHHGPNRIYVSMARRLAGQGIPSFRFDFSGIGDSDMTAGILPQGNWLLAETVSAMDFLMQEFGARRFVLCGICSGADVAREVALADDRVSGVLQIDGYAEPSSGFYLRSYASQIRRIRSWKKLFQGGSNLLPLLKSLLKKRPEDATSTTVDTRDSWLTLSPKEHSQRILTAVERGISTFLVYSSGSPAYYNHKKFVRPLIRSARHNPALRIQLIAGADHGFTLNCHQEQLFDAVEDWVATSVLNQASEQYHW